MWPLFWRVSGNKIGFGGGELPSAILPVAKPWGGGPLAESVLWRGSSGSAKAPPSALRAATSPWRRHSEDQRQLPVETARPYPGHAQKKPPRLPAGQPFPDLNPG